MAKTRCTCQHTLDYDTRAVALVPVRLLMDGSSAEYIKEWMYDEAPRMWLCPYCGDVRVEVSGSDRMVSPKTPEAKAEWRSLFGWDDDDEE